MHRYSLRPKKTMDCGSSFVKYLLFIFNFIFWIFSIAILSLGIIYKLKIASVTNYIGSEFPVAPDLFITVGAVAFVVSFFGCFGAWKENRCALLTFVALLIALLLIEIGIVVIAFIAVDDAKLESAVKKEMWNQFDKCTPDFEAIEKTFECCGVLGPDDYRQVPETCSEKGVPESCYPNQDRTKDPFKLGCFNALKNSIDKIGVHFGAIGITVAIIQVIGAGSAIMLSGVIKRNQF